MLPKNTSTARGVSEHIRVLMLIVRMIVATAIMESSWCCRSHAIVDGQAVAQHGGVITHGRSTDAHGSVCPQVAQRGWFELCA